LFRLAAAGRVWVTCDHRADGATVEVKREVREEIGEDRAYT